MALKQPVSLLHLSACALGSFIAEQALLIEKNHSQTGNVNDVDNEDLKSNIRKFAQHYDTVIPQVMHNLVTYYTLEYMTKTEDNNYENDHVFDIVLRSHVTKFDITDWPSEMYSILYRNLSKLKHLKLLRVEYLDYDNLIYVVEGIEVMKALEKFYYEYNYCWHDDIAEVLCDNCPLRSLRLNNPTSITDTAVKYLLKLRNLEELNIFSAKFSMLGTRQLLLGLPQLKTFNAPAQFSLGPECDIITSLQSVERRGGQITDLGLSKMDDISLEVLLNIVNTSCPNLKNLELDSSKMNVGVFPTEIQNAFQNLEFVNLDLGEEDMTSWLIYLLCTCINIRQVCFKSVQELCDSDIDKILSCNPLAHLWELCIEDNKLTMKSIYKLLSSCRELKYIGFVDFWETITKSEVTELLNYIKEHNLNVEIGYDNIDLPEKVSVMKPEWSDVSQSALYMYR